MLEYWIVAACSLNRALGYQGQLPWHAPADLQFFKSVTEGKIMLLGRKTLESLPGLLSKRLHIVITSSPQNFYEGQWYQTQLQKKSKEQLESQLWVASSIQQAQIQAGKAVKAGWPEQVIVAGGGQIYQLLLPECSALMITQMQIEVKGDAFFPEFDPKAFKKTASHPFEQNQIKMQFELFQKQPSQTALQVFTQALPQ